MSNYDSDSSQDEYTETNTLLGYASKEPGDDTISRLGGQPEWLDPSTPPSAALARCASCKEMMVLLLQLNGELPDNFPGHERRIYVFGCRNARCSRKEGSIRALRGVRVSKEVAEEARRKAEAEAKKQKEEAEAEAAAKKAEENSKPTTGLGEALFGGSGLGSSSKGANPFSTNNPFSSGSTLASANPFSTTPTPPAPTQKKEEKENQDTTTISTLPKTFAETLSLNNPTPPQPPAKPEPWPETSSLPKPYPTLYLVDVDYETLDPTPQAPPANVKMETDDPSSGAGSSSANEAAFESAMDATFLKFADRLAQNPEQTIRYEFRGQPLLYAKDDAVGKRLSGSGMPTCTNCGARKVFELQLTPHAIAELEAEELGLEGMEWGTVIVGVCEADCQPMGLGDGEVGYVEEWTGVQWEELRA